MLASSDIGLGGLPLQVKARKKGEEGALAKGPTSEEFEDVMTLINAKALHVANQHPEVFSEGKGPLYSFDNPPIHQAADLARAGILPQQRVPLPPRSPDMHKCIEHIFGILTRNLNTSLLRNPLINNLQMYKEEIERLFYSSITKQGVQADVQSLLETYRSIAGPSNGGWPRASLR